MSKHTYFFRHDFNAHEDERILDLRMEHGMEGYGVYWLLIELLAASSNYKLEANPKRIAFAHSADPQVVSSVINDFGLFQVEENSFYSKSLTIRMERLDEIKEKRSIAGRKGGKVKANAKQMLSKCQANESKRQANLSKPLANTSRGEESIGDESREYDMNEENIIEMKVEDKREEQSAEKVEERIDKALESENQETSEETSLGNKPSWFGLQDTSGYPLRKEPKVGTLIRDPNTGVIEEYEK
jgi:hypothetical protein